MTYSAVLLDLDGTLLDSIPDLAQAINDMRREMSLPVLPQETVAAYVGKGAEVLVRRALAHDLGGAPAPEAQVADGMARFQRLYEACNGQRARPYPGVEPGLRALREAGLKLAVVTNKPTRFTPPLLAKTGLAPYFDAVVCGDSCAHHKPHPAPLLLACEQLGVPASAAVFVGDSVNDALAARAAGMPVLVVPYGYNEGEDVQTLDVDAIVCSIEEAAHWVARHNAH